MILLTDRQIRKLIKPGMVHPKTGEQTFCEGTTGPGLISHGLSSMGYDFRLGETIKVFTNAHTSVIDPLNLDKRAFVDLAPVSVTHGDRFYRYVTIPPNGYILGETVEWVTIPDRVLGVILGKSTYARCGVIVNATPLEPGWRGRVTLEIGNLSNCPARVYLGMGICQCLFFCSDEVPEKLYDKRGGKYQDQPGLTLAK